jgi:hypothetical protein
VIASAGRIGGPARIFRPALAYLVPLGGALAAVALGVETRTVLVAVAASAIVCALVRAVVEHSRIEADRARADRWIGLRVGQPPADDLLLARVDELLDPRLRAHLARSYRRIAADAVSRGRILTPAQHNRRVLREHCATLVAVSDRLGAGSLPVAPRGMALALRLITEGGSPIYAPRAAADVGPRLAAALVALDVESVGSARGDADVSVERAA